jgi:hypothetical protein
MNFNYSYRAFLITSLLTGSLVLFLFSTKLSKEKGEIEVETYDVQVAPEDILPEDIEIASITPQVIKVETNRAYNEAEKFLSTIDNENQEITETTEGKLQEMNEALESSQNNENGTSTTIMTKAEKEKKKKLSNTNNSIEGEAVVKSGNRNTTISYQLVNRKDIDLPNPVYTCFGFGKVVINIEVNNLGKVIKNSYNKTASTTSNECLIDAALDYSKQARFNTDAAKPKQLGTITFNFPGQ